MPTATGVHEELFKGPLLVVNNLMSIVWSQVHFRVVHLFLNRLLNAPQKTKKGYSLFVTTKCTAMHRVFISVCFGA